MNLLDFNFELPAKKIAIKPTKPRDHSKLMILKKGKVIDDQFFNLIDYLIPGDLLVFNDTKVFPCRLLGKTSKGKAMEIFLLEKKEKSLCLAKPQKKVQDGDKVFFCKDLSGVLRKDSSGLTITFSLRGTLLLKTLDELGEIPLPPYILKQRSSKKSSVKDKKDYQTVYAEKEGSVAAPTAGLHFTNKLLKKLDEKGIKKAKITLHVGLGTFEPIREDDYLKHRMHSESFFISEKDAEALNLAKKEKRRIIAVGTTTARTLESAFNSDGFQETASTTDIFIYPGYKFKVINCLITNFHLPKSSLLLLVSAFSGRENILKAYGEAIKKDYRFYSYGDAMLLM